MTEILHTRMGVLTYLAPTGSVIDSEGQSALLSTVESCIELRQTKLVLDLGQVATLNGATLETLLDIQERLARLGGSLKVVNGNALLTDIFLATGFSNYIEVIDKRQGRYA